MLVGSLYAEENTMGDVGPDTFLYGGGSFDRQHFESLHQQDNAVVAVSNPVSDDVSVDDNGMDVEEPKQM